MSTGEDVLINTGTGQVLTLGAGEKRMDDDTFFENLPTIMAELSEKLGRLVEIEEESVQRLAAVSAAAPIAEVSSAKEDLDEDAAASDDGAATAGEPEAGAAPGEASPLEPEAAAAPVEASPTEDGPAPDAAEPEAGGAEASSSQIEGDAEAEPGAGDAATDGSEEQGDVSAEQDETAGAPASDPAPAAAPGEAPATEVAAKSDAEATAADDTAPSSSEAEAGVQAEAPAVPKGAPQAPTLLDALLAEEVVVSDAEIEERMIKMNKGMRKCASASLARVLYRPGHLGGCSNCSSNARRMDWSGAPLMDTVNPDLKAVLPPLSTLTQKTKGRKRASDKVAPLERIMGYTHEGADDDDDDDDVGGADGDEGDGVVEREAIKRMAAKMEARAAKARAEAE